MKKGEKEPEKSKKVDGKYLIDGKYGISDLLNINQLKELFEEFNRATGFTIGFLDHPGLNILIATGWRDICTKFHRIAPKSLDNCLKSNHRLLDKLKRPGQVVIEGCKNGMVDCATPIIIEGKHIASLATGQLLLKKPDISRFKKQAELFGYDEKTYLKALEDVPVVDAQTLRNITKFLGSMAVILSQAGYSRLIHEREIAERKKSEQDLRIKEQLISGVSNNLQSAMIYQMIIKKDGSRKLTYLSDSVRKFYGISPEEGIKDHHLIYKRFYKDDQERIHKEEEKAIKNFSTFKCEARVNDPSGKVRWSYFVSIPRKLDGDICFDGIEFDITESKEREDKLKEGEKKFRELFDNSGEAIVIYEVINNGKDIVIKDMNRVAQELEKVKIRDVVGKKVDEVFKGVRAFGLYDIFKEVWKTGKSVKYPISFYKDKYHQGWRDNFVYKIPSGEVVAIYSDVSERKKAEEELKESEQKYKLISEKSKATMMLTSSEGKTTYVSPNSIDIFGWPAEELVGDFKNIFYPEDYKSVLGVLSDALKGKSIKNFRYRVVGKDKVVRWISHSCNPIFNEDGKLKEVVSVIINIDEIKKAEGVLTNYNKQLEEDVKKRTSFLNSIVENVPNMIFVKDAKDLRFELFNRAGEDLLGYKRENMIGKNDYDFFPKKQADFFIEKDRGVLKSGKLLDIPEEPIDTKSGQRFLHTRKIPIFDENGKPAYLLGISEDITERKRSEEKLKEAFDKLKEAEALKSRFLTITSHELKTPLTPAKIQTQMLLEGDLGKLSDQQKESFEIILRNINRLSRLIDDILEVSRIQTEGFNLHIEKLNLDEIIQLVVQGLDPVAKNKGLKGISYEAGSLPCVKADKQRIGEVLTNLLDNAIKFTNRGGIHVKAVREGSKVIVEVKDSGAGIPEDSKSKIFQPFFQVEPTFTRKHGGTGLGLSICKEIIEKHGGKIWFDSKEGKGSTFYFSLPINC